MSLSRRHLLALSAASVTAPRFAFAQGALPPIVFVPGDGDSAALWQSVLWRFESNGWPAERLFAVAQPLPVARDDDTKPQPGRSSAAEHRAFVQAEVERALKATGAKQVVLVGLSRGGYGVRDYIQNAGGDKVVSHAILCGTPNHGVQAIPGTNEGNEYSGTGPFLKALNAPKNAAGDEVTGPVKWLVIRSDKNDKYAQPDGLWLGFRGVDTKISYDAPELKGATNVVIPRIDHRETATSPAAFEAMHRFITGTAPKRPDIAPDDHVMLSGKICAAGTNIGLAGAKLDVYAIDPILGERKGPAVLTATTKEDGAWGAMHGDRDARYEFVISAPGYATTHFFRSPFPRSSTVVNFRPERVPEADRNAPSLVLMYRPRGYLDPGRDKMAFDGQSPPPGAVLGAGIATSRIKPTGLPRAVVAEFNGERVVGRFWPLAENHVSVLEVTY